MEKQVRAWLFHFQLLDPGDRTQLGLPTLLCPLQAWKAPGPVPTCSPMRSQNPGINSGLTHSPFLCQSWAMVSVTPQALGKDEAHSLAELWQSSPERTVSWARSVRKNLTLREAQTEHVTASGEGWGPGLCLPPDLLPLWAYEAPSTSLYPIALWGPLPPHSGACPLCTGASKTHLVYWFSQLPSTQWLKVISAVLLF